MAKYKCPYCPSKVTMVKETRVGSPFKRTRYCPKCAKRFNTIEVHLDTDSEDYINLVARMSTEKMLERLMKGLNAKAVQTALNAQLKKQAGIRKGKISSPAEIFG